jgi:hypothetical protein
LSDSIVVERRADAVSLSWANQGSHPRTTIFTAVLVTLLLSLTLGAFLGNNRSASPWVLLRPGEVEAWLFYA